MHNQELCGNLASRSPQGERGLKLVNFGAENTDFSRSPQGERGLKYKIGGMVRKSWRRSPQGERGLKYGDFDFTLERQRRSPQGERGLKSFTLPVKFPVTSSLPARGAWIEMLQRFTF